MALKTLSKDGNFDQQIGLMITLDVQAFKLFFTCWPWSVFFEKFQASDWLGLLEVKNGNKKEAVAVSGLLVDVCRGRAGQGASANCGNIQQSASSQAITPLQCNILYKALVYWPYSALFHPILWPYSRPSVAACSSVLSGRARWGQCALGTSSHCLKTTAMAAAPASAAGQN